MTVGFIAPWGVPEYFKIVSNHEKMILYKGKLSSFFFPLCFYSSNSSTGSFIIFCGPDLSIITVNNWSWQHVRVLFSKYFAIIVFVSQLGRFVVSCGCHHCQFCPVLHLWLELYSLTLRWCRYSWGSPSILHAAMEASGFRPKCQLLLPCVVCTNQVSQQHLQPCGWLQLLLHLWKFHSLGYR